MFNWFEPVLYLDPVAQVPETTEKPGFFVEFADNVGDILKFKILKNAVSTVLHRSVVYQQQILHTGKRESHSSLIYKRLWTS
jgi:hypothetical protein